MDPNEIVRVYTTHDWNEAVVVRIALQAEGIQCELENEHQGGFSNVLPIALLVRAADVDHARQVIEEYEAKKDETQLEEPEEDEELQEE